MWAFSSLGGYRRAWIGGDLVAGLTVWAVLVPEAFAYATIAGVSPVVGLYAAPPALVFYAAFGSAPPHRRADVGDRGAVGVDGRPVRGARRRGVRRDDDRARARHRRGRPLSPASRGWGSSRTSSPSRCIKGFIVGLALTIIIGQVPSLLGVEKGSGDFFAKLWDLLTSLGTANAATVAVGALSLALVLGLRRVAPAVPASLVAVILDVLAVKALSLENHGVDIVGAIKSGLPSVGLPDVSTADFGDLVGPAIGVLLVGFAEPARGRTSPGWCAPRSPS